MLLELGLIVNSDMLASTISFKDIDQPVRLFKLNTESINLNIVHIGKLSSYLDSFFLKNKLIENSTQIDVTDNEIEDVIDIILVNSDTDAVNLLRTPTLTTETIVPYTKLMASEATADFINISLIPILIKYIIKIKESLNFISKRKVQNQSDLFLLKVRQAIDNNIDDHSLSMKKLCDLLYMSRSTLSKKIKALTGLKPTEFINSYKLEKSKHLLIVTNWQIIRISDSLGFCSQQYFCRLFKKQEGISPSRYRSDNKVVR